MQDQEILGAGIFGEKEGMVLINNELLKRCWPIIKNDFYQLCHDFQSNSLCLRSINNSFITLVRKIDGAQSTSDFKPISILNSSIKLLTKRLANRAHNFITRLVHQNQYCFIKQRTIQDCLALSFEYLHLCQHSEKEIVVLKLDFEKAFDKIEHQAIVTLLKARGFGDKWVA